jgi:type VI secretion system protein VasL
MNSHTYVLNPQKLKINSHDPRCHQLFLLLSSDMNNWKAHINDHGWWQEREKQCFGLFHQYGYDLQCGVWYCLISCQRNGWQGLASASLMLANGFAKQQKPCWPPLAAQDIRRQILDWYCIHLLPLIYSLPLTAAGTEHYLRQLLAATELLQTHARTLNSTQSNVLQQLSVWLDSNINVVRQLMPPPETVRVVASPQILPSPLQPEKKVGQKVKYLWGIAGAAIGIVSAIIITNINKPEFINYSNRIWPGNTLYAHWRQQLEEKSVTQTPDTSYFQLNQQLDILEQRLIDAEQKRKSYVTISELKTVIYQMRNILRQQETTVEYQLNQLQFLRRQQHKIPPVILSSLHLKLEALNSRYLLLSSDVE